MTLRNQIAGKQFTKTYPAVDDGTCDRMVEN